MTIVSKLQLNHPSLGTAGGAGLHSSIESLYTKIGDNMADRWFSLTDFDQAETVDLEHNFETDISNLRYDLYNYTGGEWVRLTADTSPARSAFSVIEKVGFEDTILQITNNTGGNNLTFAVCLTFDSVSLVDNDVKDIDIVSTTPEDGQALVYEASTKKFKPGASGDSSFKLQGVTDPSVTIKGGYLILDDGREIATYDGSGTAATDFGTDLTVNLTTVFGSTPANATTYYLYLDLLNLGSEVTIDNGRKVYSVAAADTTKFYLSTTKPESINRARYAVIGFVKSATSGNAWSGTGAAFGTVASKKHDNGPVAVNPVVYTLPKQAVGSVGSSGQVVAGHVLDINSFPVGSSSGNTSINNLVNGSGVNALGAATADFTPNGSPSGATSILGIANGATALNGTTQYFSSLSNWFDAGSNDFTTGIWVKPTDWTPATTSAIISAGSAGDVSIEALIIATTGVIRFYYPLDASNQGSIDIPNSFADGSWHHVAVKYKASTTTFSFYVDGALVGSVVQANRNMVTDKFNIGANTAGAQKLTGSIDEFFWTYQALSDEEIRKLYSAKISHNANVATAYQEWTANIYSKVASQDDQSWLVDKTDKDNLFIDFSGLASTDSVEIMLKNTGLTPVIVSPVPPFDQTYTSAPTFPITHGQPVIPSVEIMQEVSSGVWETISPEGYVQANSTQLVGSVAALFTGGATKVRIIAKSPQNDATGVKQAEANSYGIVKGGKVPGATDGAAIAPGYIGEIILGTSATGITVTSANTIFGNSTTTGVITLYPGIYLLAAYGHILASDSLVYMPMVFTLISGTATFVQITHETPARHTDDAGGDYLQIHLQAFVRVSATSLISTKNSALSGGTGSSGQITAISAMRTA